MASSIKCDHEASICIKFDGSNADAGYCSLESLDANEASTYPIVCCEISSGYQGKTKIEMPRRAQSADKCATLTFTAANATIDFRIKNSEFRVAEIKLDGKLHCTKLDLDCEDVLEVREYPNHQGETLPGSVFVAKDEDFHALLAGAVCNARDHEIPGGAVFRHREGRYGEAFGFHDHRRPSAGDRGPQTFRREQLFPDHHESVRLSRVFRKQESLLENAVPLP